MTVIGIDPGLAACGVAGLSGEHCLLTATWKHGPDEGTDEERGAAYVRDLELSTLSLQGGDTRTVLACERQYSPRGGAGAQLMSPFQVTLIRGMLSGAAAAWGWRVVSVTPAEAKLALTGRGNATKEQMRKMAQARFGLDALPTEHVADALGIALAAQRKLAPARSERA